MTTQTDVVEDPQTDAVIIEDEPTNTDVVVDEVVDGHEKTRAEKTAEKLGMTVDEFKEAKTDGSLIKRIEALESISGKFQENSEKEALKAEIGENFDSFYAEYSDLVSMGADKEKAKEKAKLLAGISKQEDEKTSRTIGRANATLQPVGDIPIGTVRKYPLLTKQSFGTLINDKGVKYYKKYVAYCKENGQPTYK